MGSEYSIVQQAKPIISEYAGLPETSPIHHLKGIFSIRLKEKISLEGDEEGHYITKINEEY